MATPQQIQLVGSAPTVPPPSNFGIGVPDTDLATAWPDWLKTFNRFALISNLGIKTRKEQVGTVLYAVAPVANKVLTVLVPVVDKNIATLQQEKDAFSGYFSLEMRTLTERRQV